MSSEERLKWQCRRGMRELDVLLGDWLERRYPQADGERKAAFRRLLELPDPELCGYLLGGRTSADVIAADVIREIRDRHSS